MRPQYVNGNVQVNCPDCGGATTSFEHRDASRQFGNVVVERAHMYDGKQYARTQYVLMRCAGCQRGGIAKIHDNGAILQGTLEDFYPISIQSASIPTDVPPGIATEFREAERCESYGTYRASSALYRSTLEKALKANGYNKGSLEDKIDLAAADGVITEARRKRAHEDIRVLGNDVLHDEWRQVTEQEVAAAHQYTARILEDFYDDRPSVEKILVAKTRIVGSAPGP